MRMHLLVTETRNQDYLMLTQRMYMSLVLFIKRNRVIIKVRTKGIVEMVTVRKYPVYFRLNS